MLYAKLSKASILNKMTFKLLDFLMQFLSSQKDPEVARYFDGELGRVVKRFQIVLMSDQQKGEILNEKQLDAFAYFLTGIFYGLQAVENEAILNQNALKKVISNALIDFD